MSASTSTVRWGRAVAEARTNIALVKYWGKRDAALNLPAAGSLSLTLDGLVTRTEVRFDGKLNEDRLVLNGKAETGKPVTRISQVLDLIAALAGGRERPRAQVESTNSFPTAAGLASSASAFAALALAGSGAAGLQLPPPALSVLARRGSGSAARSVLGGVVLMNRGTAADGLDSHAEELLSIDEARAWGLRMVVAVTSEGPKETLSTDGMNRTQETSPYYAAWIKSVDGDLAAARQAVLARDLPRLGELTEQSCLSMHASALAARPAVVYFRGVTIEGHRAVQQLRKAGTPVWFTCDAGPHIKALTDAAHADAVAAALGALPGVLSSRVCLPGAPAQLIESGSGAAA
jgi:diphosphomevalonate decarboxylase